MIFRLISFGILISIFYTFFVFFFPEMADKYGKKELNAKIRNIKTATLEFSSGSENPLSLFEKVKDSSTLYIEETKKTYNHIENTLSGKVNDIKEAADSAQKAYNAVTEAKKDIEKAFSVSWTIRP